ncbi:hypothetical protein ACTJJE_22890 [Mycolicibacterium sp. 22603]|uniref:hypothetical protein n=1 Tax=Mycolicibacterium sp. 22603 TaxID=3453950 RepID=UPI003F83077D
MTIPRKRILVLSAPVVLILLLIAGLLRWSAMADRAATQRFADGVAAARDDRLLQAEEDFVAVLGRVDGGRSCSLRVDLVLVRETLGDRAVAAVEADDAREHYRRAGEVVEQAPPGCFADNTDSDPDRREIRAQAAARLAAKIAALSQPLPPVPQPPPAGAPPPPAASTPGSTSTPGVQERRLNPEQGDPLDRLRDILRDAEQV